MAGQTDLEREEALFADYWTSTQRSFIQAGKILKMIKLDEFGTYQWKRLYGTWETYCRDRLGLSQYQADKIISASEIGAIAPISNVGQARALAPVKHDPELMKEIVETVTVETGGKVTAKAIAAEVNRRAPAAPPMTREDAVTETVRVIHAGEVVQPPARPPKKTKTLVVVAAAPSRSFTEFIAALVGEATAAGWSPQQIYTALKLEMGRRQK